MILALALTVQLGCDKNAQVGQGDSETSGRHHREGWAAPEEHGLGATSRKRPA